MIAAMKITLSGGSRPCTRATDTAMATDTNQMLMITRLNRDRVTRPTTREPAPLSSTVPSNRVP